MIGIRWRDRIGDRVSTHQAPSPRHHAPRTSHVRPCGWAMFECVGRFSSRCRPLPHPYSPRMPALTNPDLSR
jgi:hypothetical protein